jgi:hypothetical protein
MSPSETDVRDILDSVAAGRITPQEASALLAAASSSDPVDRPDRPDPSETVDEAESVTTASRTQSMPSSSATPEPVTAARVSTTSHDAPAASSRPNESAVRPTGSGPTRLRVRAVGRRVRIVGEPFLSTVAVEGPHVMRHDGDVLTVASEGEFQATLDNFTLRTPNLRDLQERFVDLTRELVIKVNPRLDVEIEVTAGSVSIERAPRVSHVRITAGSAKLRDVTGPLDLLVQGGSATVEGGISVGDSKLRVESGSLQVNLLVGTNATVTNDVQLGRLSWDGESGGPAERIVGNGAAGLRIEGMMGAVNVREAL